jgi:hypothetical protein
VCATIAWRLDVAWPEALAAEMRGLLDIAMGDIP